jgi:ornithine cyclodeaminase
VDRARRRRVTGPDVAGGDIPSLDDELTRLAYPDAIAAIRSALHDGLDPETQPPRSIVSVGAGQLLIMPAELGGRVGVKTVSVAPGNPELGRPRIQGEYVLWDGQTLSPLARLDAEGLTAIRTASVSAAVADRVAHPDARTVHVFGAGVQAESHIRALAAVRRISTVTVSARRPHSVERLADGIRDLALDVRAGGPERAADADLVVCATTSTDVVLPPVPLRPGCVVMAVGSHEPDVREVGTETMLASTVIVDGRAHALAENGNVVIPVASGALHPEDLLTMKDVVTGAVEVSAARPVVFVSSGMGWQDLALVVALERARASRALPS